MILILGGTLESRELVRFLQHNKIPLLVSTYSLYGETLAKEFSSNVQSGALDERRLELLCQEEKIKTIIDATHPYAINISKIAIKIANTLHINYLRYEREATNFDEANPLIKRVNSTNEAVLLAEQMGNNILLTIGTRQLEAFQALFKSKKVFVRVLPEVESINKCINLGLEPINIIAIQGPFSHQFNHLLIKEKGIDLVITKNSGQIGGTDTKLTACLELNVPIIIIDRPTIDYPQVAKSLEEVAIFLEEADK